MNDYYGRHTRRNHKRRYVGHTILENDTGDAIGKRTARNTEASFSKQGPWQEAPPKIFGKPHATPTAMETLTDSAVYIPVHEPSSIDQTPTIVLRLDDASKSFVS